MKTLKNNKRHDNFNDESTNKPIKRKNKSLAKGLVAIVLLASVGVGLGCSSDKLVKFKNNIVEKSTTIIDRGSNDIIVSGKNITYEGEKHTVDVNKVSDMLKGKYKDEEKIVFLTFDDGPSPNTDKVLDILKKENVKGTFFVLGERLAEGEKAQNRLKRAIKEGHAIANHSYTHSLKKLYPGNKINVDYFMSEFHKTNDLMKEVLGKDFNTRVLRLPGGYSSRTYYKDPNLKQFNERLNKEGIVSIDWNALNGDAEGKPYSVEELVNYAKDTSKNKKKVVILMHDAYGKEKTTEALPEIIKFYKNAGYTF
ncbi:MAG: polysaccharide deacetylase family protein, partial [Sarcina sp.]